MINFAFVSNVHLRAIRNGAIALVLLLAFAQCIGTVIAPAVAADRSSVKRTADTKQKSESESQSKDSKSEKSNESPADQFDDQILDLYNSKKLLHKNSYSPLRKLVANKFVQEHDAEIRKSLGKDYEEMQKWFEANRDIYEEFCIAIDEKRDDIPGAFSVFNDLRKNFPKDLARYGSLAIATSVVWDSKSRETAGHIDAVTRQCKAKYDHDNDVLAVEGFRYFVQNEAAMQGRILYCPWEFLIHVMNQRTPIKERQWALARYGADRTMYGKCYSTVPYDHVMLETKYKDCKMLGRDYTLPNILQYGGVCAQQADFSSRVGKNLGIPAAYCLGTSDDLERHAWVMWVELKQVTKTSLQFSLESHGRYGNDHYYVGHLMEPQTGRGMTDRDLEIDLYAVGNNVQAKRQSDLALRVYPRIKELAKLDTKAELALLKEIVLNCPANRDSWKKIAKVAKENRGNKEYSATITSLINQLFTTFAPIPDFTWQVFDDFVAFSEDVKTQTKMYERLCTMYESAKRPDLACEARLKYADLLLEQKRSKDAVEALAYCVKKFPDEGRYIPKLLDKIDEICADVSGTGPILVRFYKEFLPLVPKLRGKTPTKYAVQMYARAAKIFSAQGEEALAAAAQSVSDSLKAGNKRL